MKWTTLRYLFKEGITGLWRNRTMAVASIGTISLCLMILGMAYGIGINMDHLIEQMETKFGITAYIKDGLDEEAILNLKSRVEKLDYVASVTYISKEEALKSFSENNEDEDLFTVFIKDNPLPASLEIMTEESSKQAELVQTLETIEEIDSTIYFQNEIAASRHLRHIINYICLIILLILVCVGLLLMSNTIKLTIYVRKNEINIMKYVGATDRFIRIPFLIEGVLIGIIGATISTLLIAGGYEWIIGKSVQLSGVLSGLEILPTLRVISALIPIYIVLGVGIGLLGSTIALHRHLDV